MTLRTVSEDRLTIFSFLWAAAVIFHLGKWNIWLYSPVSFVLAISAVLVILKPSSLNRLYILIFLQLIDSFEKMPWIANHWLFATFVDLTILISALTLIISSRNLHVAKSKLFGAFAPAVRLELILLYLLAFFHKLNTDWLDPRVSCGTKLYLLMTGDLGFLQTPIFSEYTAIYGPLIVELMIPIFLIIRRLRIAGIIIALLFHFILGTDEYYNFSAVTFAALFLFTPANFPDRMREWWTSSAIGRTYRILIVKLSIEKVKTPVLTAIGVIAAAIFIYSQFSERYIGQHIELRESGSIGKTRLYYLFLGLWWLYGLSIIAVFLLSIRKGKCVSCDRISYFIPRYKILMIIPLLVFINGISPYLGLKTQTSWSMFSNLRTEGGISNHLLIRHPYYLANFENDLVEIKHSSDPFLNSFVEKGYLIPYFELRYYMSLKTGLSGSNSEITYIRNGSVKSVMKPGDDPGLFEPGSLLLRKLLSFRPVPAGKSSTCQQ